MNGGWYKIYRALHESKIWLDKPFGKGQAFVDLIGLANYGETEVVVSNKKYLVKRGELLKSQNYFSDRWGWDRTKVRLFLKYLEIEEMISAVTDRNATIIKIMNYEKYQSGSIQDLPEEGPQILTFKGGEVSKDVIEVRDKICKFFGFSEIRHTNNFMQATKFVEVLKERGKLPHFIEQFEAYKQYMGLLKFAPASFQNYIGNLYEQYENGKWNAENWKLKLDQRKENDNTKSKATAVSSRYYLGEKDYKNASL